MLLLDEDEEEEEELDITEMGPTALKKRRCCCDQLLHGWKGGQMSVF